jgi:PAS domain S-box-containing protein
VSAASPQTCAEELQARVHELQAERDALRTRLADAEETLEAIQNGQVDALVIDSPEGQKIFSLTGAERPYRALIEQMTEGAVTMDNEGSIRYCNKAFAELLRRPLEDMTGDFVDQYVQGTDRDFFLSMLRHSRSASMRGEIGLCAADDVVPAYVSLTRIVDSDPESVCMVVTNLTERKQAERTSSSEQFVQGPSLRTGQPSLPGLGAQCIDDGAQHGGGVRSANRGYRRSPRAAGPRHRQGAPCTRMRGPG